VKTEELIARERLANGGPLRKGDRVVAFGDEGVLDSKVLYMPGRWWVRTDRGLFDIGEKFITLIEPAYLRNNP
jgi:hypothetical protein